mmetsp:Transcript_52043/g.59439  ORF Transcript_52043/g.59439 Transcript_52043/m.59439 type:complete len:84 (-) Transcript_52043:1019-1270(-)
MEVDSVFNVICYFQERKEGGFAFSFLGFYFRTTRREKKNCLFLSIARGAYLFELAVSLSFSYFEYFFSPLVKITSSRLLGLVI